MEIKKLKFQHYRYQMSPISSKQFELFGTFYTPEELKLQKNKLLDKILQNSNVINSALGSKYVMRSVLAHDNYYLFKFASRKKIKHVSQALEEEEMPDFPYVYVVINNNPQAQTISISLNYKAFAYTQVVANALGKVIESLMEIYRLSFSVAPILKESELWTMLSAYEGRITNLRFELIRPNISNISKALRESVKELANSTNSQKTKVDLTAPSEETLENLNESNEAILAISKYSAEGGGEVSFKAKNIRRRIKIKSTVRETEITDIQLKGSPKEILEVLKQLTKF